MLCTFSIPHTSSVEFGITGYTIRDGFGIRRACEDRSILSSADIYLLMHYMRITIHQRYRRTDGRHARSISATHVKRYSVSLSYFESQNC